LAFPPIVKTLSTYLPHERYSSGILVVACAGNVGIIAVTLLSPLFIRISGWRTAFYFFAGFAVAVIALWTVYTGYAVRKFGKIGTSDTGKTEEKVGLGFVRPALAAGVIFVMAAIFCEGFVKDSAITWMPTYMSEVFDMSSETSILSNLLFPILGSFVGVFATFIKTRLIRNELVIAAIFMGVSAVLSLILWVLPKNYILSLILITLIITATMAANYITIIFVPIRFSKYGKFRLWRECSMPAHLQEAPLPRFRLRTSSREADGARCLYCGRLSRLSESLLLSFRRARSRRSTNNRKRTVLRSYKQNSAEGLFSLPICVIMGLHRRAGACLPPQRKVLF